MSIGICQLPGVGGGGVVTVTFSCTLAPLPEVYCATLKRYHVPAATEGTDSRGCAPQSSSAPPEERVRECGAMHLLAGLRLCHYPGCHRVAQCELVAAASPTHV